VDLEKVYDEIAWVAFREGGQRSKNSCKQRLPQNFKDLFYLAGLFIGDGSRHKFVVGKPELAKRVISILESMQAKYYLRNYSYRTPEIGTNYTLMYILNAIFDYPIKSKSHSVRVSDFVFKAPKEYAAAFISGYFDCDGTVERARRAISLTSVSKQILKDLQLLLLRFGCISTVQGDTLYIAGKSSKIFVKDVQFGLEEKQFKAEALANSTIGSYTADTVIIEGKSQFLFGAKQLDSKLTTGDLAFIEVIGIESAEEDVVYDFTILDNHNFVAEGVVVHNTTLSDNLLAGAGMISEELAGNIQAMDYDPQEKARGITINSANVSMVHIVDGKEFLINLIDTPGHVDFGGEVTRAMRAIDTAIVLVDAVEGIMPQTETVLRQALREGVKPVLFINKVDRLIKELKLPPEKMLERFTSVINNVNKIIRGLAPKEFKDAWTVNVQNGTVCFGSAKHRWALSIPYMKKKNFSLKQVVDAYASEDAWTRLGRQVPLHEAVLDMIVAHGSNPKQAQAYRIPIIWHGEVESEIGKSLLNGDPSGPTVFVVIKVIIDPQAGEVFTGRLFSGKITKGTELFNSATKNWEKAQQVFIYKGATRIPIEIAASGNIIGMVGLKNAGSGDTVSSVADITPFEAIKHLFEPVVTKAIESKNPKDLPKLIEALKDIAKQDPTIAVTINEETGENLISGLGELHLEIWEYRIINDKGLQIVTSPPIVVYRETIKQAAKDIEGKSPNRHNKVYVTVEPLEESVATAIKEGKIPEVKLKKRKREVEDALVEVGLDKDEAKQVVQIFKGNLLIEATRGLVHIGEIIEMVMEAFEEISKAGPMCKEPCFGLKIKLTDAKLHEDAIHRGPGQMIPCVKQAITNAMLVGGDILFEPKQIIRIDIPTEYLNETTKLVAGRRGELQEVIQEEAAAIVKAKIPVNEMFGFTAALRSATSGRGAWFLSDQVFEKLPNDLQTSTILKLRERKGMPKEMPRPIFD